MVEALAPAVVWFDEIEMGLTGQTGQEATNLGRIFAFFLTWMQEKARGLFVAATANRIDLLPAEMIRKGRFDEVFFIDLPGEEERVEIFRIHLVQRGIDPETMQLTRLRRITQGWTGAEIEQCVISAITTVRLEDRALTFDDLHAAAQNVIPLSKTMREQVDHIRSWAYDRAVRASPREDEVGERRQSCAIRGREWGSSAHLLRESRRCRTSACSSSTPTGNPLCSGRQ